MTAMNRIFFTALVLLIGSGADHLWARGGGGCLREGTLIDTPSGTRAIESLVPGDTVYSVSHGMLIPAQVCDVMKVAPDHFCELVIRGHKLQVTDEHPVETAPGEFCIASRLKAGDMVNCAADAHLFSTVVEGVRQTAATNSAWNLLVSPGGTYVADGVVVHNKGCFLPETLIRRQDGSEKPISQITPQERILAFTVAGQVVTAVVEAVIVHDVEEFRILKTAAVTLHVTAEHPFYIGDGRFKTLEALNVGDSIYAYDGYGLSRQAIESITPIKTPVRVYNLHTDAPNTFFANGIAVHNKGGGGGHGGGGFHGGSSFHGGSRGGGNGSPWPALIIIGTIFGIVIIQAIVKKRSGSRADENLDFVFKQSDVAAKRDKTLKLLDFLSRQDPSVAPPALKKVTEGTFLLLQQCWQAREYGPMKPLMMPDLYADHCAQLDGMKRHHEINMIEGVNVNRIDLVNVRYTTKENQREFTALITATARDYYVDEQTRRKTRGDDAPAQFQEFWTFQYLEKSWRLREIEQSRESSILKEDNFFEQFTDVGVDQIYGSLAKGQGVAGPWLEKQVEAKETRIERMLNFLVQTDKVWDRQSMLETSRRVFIALMTAWESGEVGADMANDLFPDMVVSLREQMASQKEQNVKLEFKNLCVRKVELILVRNFDENEKDEFVVRIRAHSQRVMIRADAVVHQDEDVVPFEQNLTFGRVKTGDVIEKRWRLKEIIPEGEGTDLIVRENLDQDSNLQQLHWYYQHKRAV